MTEERVAPIKSTCHRGPSDAVALELHFTGTFQGVPMEFRNTAEVDAEETMVVSMMRPLGSDQPFAWHNTLYGVRPDTAD